MFVVYIQKYTFAVDGMAVKQDAVPCPFWHAGNISSTATFIYFNPNT